MIEKKLVPKNTRVFLASGSPRRKFLLEQLGFQLTVIKVEFEEEVLPDETPAETVLRLAEHKLNAAIASLPQINEAAFLLTADTIVVLDNNVLGKPKDKADAVAMLSMLSNRTHTVLTGYALKNFVSNEFKVNYVSTEVRFRKLDDYEILNYVEGGSPLDKAGAYGIQDDFGAVFVENINGCYYNVVGLPLQSVYNTMKEMI